MQRLSSISRAKENQQNNEEKGNKNSKESSKHIDSLKIPAEVVFLISRFNNKIKSSVKAGFMTTKKCKTKNDLNIESPYRFTYDFYRNKRMNCVTVKNSCLIDLQYFKGVNIERLEFENITNFDICRIENAHISTLVLKGIKISLSDLNKLIFEISPSGLELINVSVTDQMCTGKNAEFIKTLYKLDLWFLNIEDSFLSAGCFFEIVHRKDIKKFQYKKGSSVVKYRNVGPTPSYLVVRCFEFFEYLNQDWLFVDMLSIDSISILNKIDQNNHNLKYLWLEDTVLNTSSIRKLPKLSSIYLKKCVFENLGFYELINTQKYTLEYISIDGTDIPFDAVQYINDNIKKCEVFYNSIQKRSH
jgi:hypothetical protein